MTHIDEQLALKEYPKLKQEGDRSMAAVMETELAHLAGKAYNETKPKDDPDWANVHSQYKFTLMEQARSIEQGNPSQNPTPFERRLTELIKERAGRSYSENVKAEQDAILKEKQQAIEDAKAHFDDELKVEKQNAKTAVAAAKEIEKNDPNVGSGQSSETQTQWKDSEAREMSSDFKGDEGEKGHLANTKNSGKSTSKSSSSTKATGGKSK